MKQLRHLLIGGSLLVAVAGASVQLMAGAPATQPAGPAPESWSNPVRNVSVGIAVASPPIYHTDDVWVRVWIKNVGANSAFMVAPFPSHDFKVDLTDAHGQVPQTRWGRFDYRKSLVHTLELPAGDSRVFDLCLSSIRDTTLPGSYKLTVSVPIMDPDAAERGTTIWLTSPELIFSLSTVDTSGRPPTGPAKPWYMQNIKDAGRE
jgi:hypothetical protein